MATTGTPVQRTPKRARTGGARVPRSRGPQRPAVRAAARGAHPPRAPFVLLVVGLLGGALVALLVLNTTLAEDAFKLKQIKQQTNTMQQQEQALKQRVQRDEAPQALARSAYRLGMRPGPRTPAFLRPGGDRHASGHGAAHHAAETSVGRR